MCGGKQEVLSVLVYLADVEEVSLFLLDALPVQFFEGCLLPVDLHLFGLDLCLQPLHVPSGAAHPLSS